MATASDTNFAAVQSAFERVYAQARHDSGMNAPDSYVWFAPTPRALVEEVGRIREQIEESDGDPVADEILGDANEDTIAWAWECNGPTLARITSNVSDEELVGFFRGCMGYDD